MRADQGFLQYSPEPLDLGDDEGRHRRLHVFQPKDVHAVNAALAACRPLLLRGKPGTGKSQLALAAAVGLGRVFVSTVIDARSESRDLLWRFDAVRRLADAQAGAVQPESSYISPGPLWWALDWKGAEKQAGVAGTGAPSLRPGCDPSRGVVVLLDEIDKADSSVPNGLLGALGNGEFEVPGVGPVTIGKVEPLVVLTTNEERALPDAFLRRCAVHRLVLDRDPQALRRWLVLLGEAHFPKLVSVAEPEEGPSGGILGEAADLVLRDRRQCLLEGVHPPGVAEYLDLLRVLDARSTTEEEAREVLGIASEFFLKKNVPEEDP